ncbi:DUF1684 domain-containing protein [Arthrobacter sp. H35-D1]|uniref:DUF1684 domain-containing protein n=1 Tax=Arthrobacter sp. H35-D1 TaxID=3046202 RepID=UPI0024BA2605|nr:DUF1684 domain-containing protein [Arthrobacter sp. H35-D1]MDJ0315497.1 DUF1684 domain-containing protein [Arthrobacter sp. H35-D1]
MASAVGTADWRLRTFALYSQVRAVDERDGAAAAHELWVRERDAMFASHPASALDSDQNARFTGLAVEPYDLAWRFSCKIGAEGAGQEMSVDTGTDGTVAFVRLGTFDIPDVGKLAVWRHAGYGGGIFLPFRDATSGADGGSYGAGRYLLDTIKGAHLGVEGERFNLDFNFAYNPSCAYNPVWACPVPGADNRLAVPVPVGEMYLPQLGS